MIVVKINPSLVQGIALGVIHVMGAELDKSPAHLCRNELQAERCEVMKSISNKWFNSL